MLFYVYMAVCEAHGGRRGTGERVLPVRGGGQTIYKGSWVNLRSQDDLNVPHRVLLETTASVNFSIGRMRDAETLHGAVAGVHKDTFLFS